MTPKKNEELILQTFKAFYTDNLKHLPPELRINYLCMCLNISYTELCKQPAWWVYKYQILLEGKNRADNERLKKVKQSKRR